MVCRRLHQCLRYKRTVTKRRTSYAWALLAERSAVQELGDDAYAGLGYATLMAEADRARCQVPIRVAELLPPMTIGEIAEMENVSPTTVRRRIARARQELFGSLSMSGIYDRRRRAARAKSLRGRICAASDCGNPLPRASTARREFCHPRCRRREHYRRH